jgi:hypothetical protein
MSSLVYKSIVLAVGQVEEFDDRFEVDGTQYPKSVFASAFKVEGEPSGAGSWLYEGEDFFEAPSDPEPAPQPVVVPQSITPRQARLALLGAGLLETVQAAFAEIPEPQRTAAQIEWDYALTIERGSPLVAQMAAALGMTDEQVDALFVAGAQL